MTFTSSPWIAVFFGMLALSPVHAGMTPQEVSWFKDAKEWAEKGEAEGQCSLGICYFKGEGVAKDDVQAAAWWRKAALQGNARAQTLLGHAYFFGEGVPQDQGQAVSWYRQAAEQGLAEAQYNLGSHYADGKGVAKDFVQAVKWYRQASEQGYVLAQFNLGGCYANGVGVAKDQIEAYAYWNQGTVEYARKKLAALEKQMTADQIADGQKRTKVLKKEIAAKIAAKTAEDEKKAGK